MMSSGTFSFDEIGLAFSLICSMDALPQRPQELVA